MTGKEVLTLEETAEFFSVAPDTIKQWKQEGFLPYFKIKGTLRFSRRSLLKLMDDNEVPAGRSLGGRCAGFADGRA